MAKKKNDFIGESDKGGEEVTDKTNEIQAESREGVNALDKVKEIFKDSLLEEVVESGKVSRKEMQEKMNGALHKLQKQFVDGCGNKFKEMIAEEKEAGQREESIAYRIYSVFKGLDGFDAGQATSRDFENAMENSRRSMKFFNELAANNESFFDKSIQKQHEAVEEMKKVK